jgi:hypothetical protein
MLDQLTDKTATALIIQKKLLQQQLLAAGSKLNKMIPLFASEPDRPRKPIFDNKPA